MSAGVAAAFECKTTLQPGHLKKAADTAAFIRRLSAPRTGTPYRELTRPPVYGVLAHSHPWKKPRSTPAANVEAALAKIHAQAAHPRDLIDIICVADLGCWTMSKIPFISHPEVNCACTTYTSWRELSDTADVPPSNPIAVAISILTKSLAWEDLGMRPLADYLGFALAGQNDGALRPWAIEQIFTSETASHLRNTEVALNRNWNEWAFPLP